MPNTARSFICPTQQTPGTEAKVDGSVSQLLATSVAVCPSYTVLQTLAIVKHVRTIGREDRLACQRRTNYQRYKQLLLKSEQGSGH